MPIQFVTPSLLWLLALICIPIIIHLFNFRRFKKIDFTNVRFLKELKDQTQSQSKLKHLLVLISRILAIAFLVLAFAQPFIPKNKSANAGGQAVVSFYIDNSFSMKSLSSEGNLLDEAKAKARDAAEAYPPSTQFQLLTNDFRGEQQRLLSKEEFLDNLDKVKVSSFSRTSKEVLARQQDALSTVNTANKTAFWFSDFQKTFLSELPATADTTLKLNAVMLNAAENGNIYIDSCWLSSPVIQLNTPVELSVLIKNTGSKDDVDVPLKFAINDVQKAVTTIKVAANNEAVAKINFTVTQPGWQRAMVSLDDNPITFDDAYFFSFRLADKINVYHIGNGQNVFVKKLLAENALINYTFANQNGVDFSALQNNNAVVLTDMKEVPSGMSEELSKFVGHGGTLIIFPDTLINVNGYSALMSTLQVDNYTALNGNADKIGKIDFENDLFKNMFDKVQENMNLPDVLSHYDLTSPVQSTREVLLRLQGGSPFLNRYKSGKGSVYIFASAAQPSAGAFVTHALFVPVLFKAVLQSVPAAQQSFVLGNRESVTLSYPVATDEVIHLTNKKLNVDAIPEVRSMQGETTLIMPEITDAGFYDLTNKSDSLLSIIAMNYNRNESVISFSNEDDLNTALGNGKYKEFNVMNNKVASVSNFVKEMNSGISLWKYCIILVLLFLGIEVLLLRFLK